MKHLNQKWTQKLGDTAAGFDEALDRLSDALDDMLELRYGSGGPFETLPKPKIELEFGQKYCRIVLSEVKGGIERHRSVSGFFTLNGDILMAASYNKPTLNGARGNIFDSDSGIGAFSDTGRVKYKGV